MNLRHFLHRSDIYHFVILGRAGILGYLEVDSLLPRFARLRSHLGVYVSFLFLLLFDVHLLASFDLRKHEHSLGFLRAQLRRLRFVFVLFFILFQNIFFILIMVYLIDPLILHFILRFVIFHLWFLAIQKWILAQVRLRRLFAHHLLEFSIANVTGFHALVEELWVGGQ